jgi:hypothetical protein
MESDGLMEIIKRIPMVPFFYDRVNGVHNWLSNTLAIYMGNRRNRPLCLVVNVQLYDSSFGF